MLKKDATFYWNEECKQSLDVLKEKMVTASILVFLDWKKEFHVHVDVSCIELGVVLTHTREGEFDHPIAFASPEGYTSQQKKELMVHMTYFSVIVGYLYKMGSSEILRCYVLEFEWNSILIEAHGGAAGGHYAGKETTQKILHTGFWWPTLHKDSKAYWKACDACQRKSMPSRRDELPLNAQVSLQPFEKWAIDFVGPIQPPRKKMSAWYIINAMEHLMRWVEAQPIKDCTGEKIAKLLFEYVLTRFGCPKILMSDHGAHFLNETINALTEEFQVYHQKSMPYHP
eukprot:PITA_27851